MAMFDKLLANLKASKKTIVFTEGTDPRILSAAARLLKEDLMGVILCGNPDAVKKELRVSGFVTKEIRQSLNWQKLEIEWNKDEDIVLESLRFTIVDASKNGEIYIDNIRFI